MKLGNGNMLVKFSICIIIKRALKRFENWVNVSAVNRTMAFKGGLKCVFQWFNLKSRW